MVMQVISQAGMRKEDCGFVVSLGYIDPALNKWITTTTIFFTFCKKRKKWEAKLPPSLLLYSLPPPAEDGLCLSSLGSSHHHHAAPPWKWTHQGQTGQLCSHPWIYTLCARLLGGAMVDRKEESWSWIGGARYWVCGTGGVWVESSMRKEASEKQQGTGWVSLSQVNFCTMILLLVTQGSKS